jgi:hypothetical protein
MPVAVVKHGKLMLAHVWLTDSAFIKLRLHWRCHEMINRAEHAWSNTALAFPGPPNPRTGRGSVPAGANTI